MKIDFKLLMIILLLPVYQYTFSQAGIITKDVSKWMVTKAPVPETPSWYKANYSDYEWQVYIENGKVAAANIASERERISGDIPDFVKQSVKGKDYQCFLKVKDGWLIGKDDGEFGGSLCWYSLNGKKSYKITDDHVKEFFTTSAGILAVEGLAHLSISEGKIVQITQGSDNKWKARTFIDLKASPEVATLGKDGSLIVATTNNLLIVGMNKAVKILLNNVFWNGLYPNSIVISDTGTIYIGMRHGIARISINSKVDWLIPNKSFL